MDFRLPQPLKYSLKKKKARRKVLRKETGKLSLKNHNRNASCQTDSSESSELSGANSSKKNIRLSKTRKSTERSVLSNVENVPFFIKLDQDSNKHPASIYHYCTPARRKENIYRLHRQEANKTGCNTSDIVLEDPCLEVGVAEMIKNGEKSLLLLSEEDRSHNSIILSGTDSDSISESDDSFSKDCNDIKNSDNKGVHSDTSKSLLESSLTYEGHNSYAVDSDSPREKLTNVFCVDRKSARKDAPLFRSSVLHKKFNRAVENDLATVCSSDFYTRVKNRVLGLHRNNTYTLDEEKIRRKSGQKFCENGEPTEEDKENVDENTTGSEKMQSNHEMVIRRTMIVPDSEDGSISSCSPNHNVLVNKSGTSKHSRLSDNINHENKQKSVLVLESSIDSKSSCHTIHDNRTSSSSYVIRGQKNNKCVIPDSDCSDRFESPKRTAIYVNETSDSDSSVIEFNNDPCNVEEEIHANVVEENKKMPHSEGRYHSQKTLPSVENDHKSGSSELFRRVTKRVLILDTSDSVDKSIQEKTYDLPKEGVNNMQFKPGFSTLSQSKHEDIKKWLNAIPCHPETEELSICDVEAHGNSVLNTNERGDDNISLTEMEKVLDGLYGKDWAGRKKSIPKIVPKKKESQIIYERLTDSDDSSTPPLPASTPSKKKLYNHIKNVITPQEKNCFTPVQGINIFTPLTSVGKKGGNTLTTPRTAGPKLKREKECLNSGAFSSPVLTFLSSLSVGHQSARCHPEAKLYVKNFKSKKNDLANKLFEIFNKDVFSSKLPHDMPIIWNNRLRKTAGYCYNRRVKNSEGGFTRTSRVELSSKIVDNAARLRDTLVHELCHAATWIISEVTGGHGPSWKRWTNKAMAAFPELPPISRCHNYDIVTKYKYQCVSCSYSIGRHSKSLDIQRKCCGICGGTFELFLNTKDESGKSVPKTPRTLNAFALFVKENYKATKKSQDNLKHKDVMKLLSAQFAETKISSVQNEK